MENYRSIMNYFINGRSFEFNPEVHFDLSLALDSDFGPRAWYQNNPVFEPVRMGDWVGEVKSGGAVNFRNIFFNPHAHLTHTESFGHIAEEIYSVNRIKFPLFIPALLISVEPKQSGTDLIIDDHQIQKVDSEKWAEALLIRTLPNSDHKKNKNYSNENPPYLSSNAGRLIASSRIKHLLIDTPSVDKERDEGKLDVHHIFWNYPENPRKQHSITEMFFAGNEIPDGYYLLNLQVAPMENDAAPSRPILYPGRLLP